MDNIFFEGKSNPNNYEVDLSQLKKTYIEELNSRRDKVVNSVAIQPHGSDRRDNIRKIKP